MNAPPAPLYQEDPPTLWHPSSATLTSSRSFPNPPHSPRCPEPTLPAAPWPQGHCPLRLQSGGTPPSTLETEQRLLQPRLPSPP
ncbi:hypothetical protein P7K49_030371 [Saguinus oedipus]|uniref:Uncharacterized protein n=1 Tax=Saguinus oedipus TaxID=9490 RepID=A0ABQ9U404_SAGOE|nr:hypothetical protein P7K49_030371 [Saguinus oedipus]